MMPADLAENVGRKEKAFDKRQEPIIRFLLDDGDWLGMPLFRQVKVKYIKEHSAVLFMFDSENIVVAGPQALALHVAYCAHWAQDIRSDGKGIVSVRTVDRATVRRLLRLPVEP